MTCSHKIIFGEKIQFSELSHFSCFGDGTDVSKLTYHVLGWIIMQYPLRISSQHPTLYRLDDGVNALGLFDGSLEVSSSNPGRDNQKLHSSANSSTLLQLLSK